MIKTQPLNSSVLQPSTPDQTRSRRRFRLPQQLPLHIVIIVLLLIMLFPFFWMVGTSLKPDAEATPGGLAGKTKDLGTFLKLFWPSEFHFENYVKAWNTSYNSTIPIKSFFEAPFATYFFNSLVIGVAETVGVLITSILAGYAFARMEFVGKGFLFAFILATLSIPHEASYIPNLVIVSQLGNLASWLGANTYTALFLPWIASAFYIFLLRQFFMGIPNELYEASLLDGISQFGFLWRIAMPLSSPAILTVALFAFLGNWNAFLWPLIVAPNIPVVQTGLRTFLATADVQTEWNLLMAASTIVIIPIVLLYFLVQKRFIEGISRTGIK